VVDGLFFCATLSQAEMEAIPHLFKELKRPDTGAEVVK